MGQLQGFGKFGTSAIAETAEVAVRSRGRAPVPVAALGVVVFLFVAACALYLKLRTLGDAPDELSHLAYLRLISDHFQLPVNMPERQQPPLFYLLGAALYKLSGSLVTVHGLSVMLGVLTLITVAQAARELWPGSPGLQVLAPAIVAADPEFQFLSGVISNDALAYAAAGWLTFLIVRVARRPPDRRTYVAVGMAIAVGLLAKETDYFLAALLALVSVTAWRGRAKARGAWLVVAIPLVAAGWWFARNLVTYHNLLPTLHPLAAAAPQKLTDPGQVLGWVVSVFVSSFALFGNMDVPISVGRYPVYLALGLGSVAITALGLRAAVHMWPAWGRPDRLLALALAAIPALALGQMVANSVLIDFQAQGRYLFVALPAVALLVCGAARHGIPRLTRRTAASLIVVVVVLATLLDTLGIQSVAAHVRADPKPSLGLPASVAGPAA